MTTGDSPLSWNSDHETRIESCYYRVANELAENNYYATVGETKSSDAIFPRHSHLSQALTYPRFSILGCSPSGVTPTHASCGLNQSTYTCDHRWNCTFFGRPHREPQNSNFEKSPSCRMETFFMWEASESSSVATKLTSHELLRK